MSKLLLATGDDHPEAAHKNLLDARALLTHARPDGAAYLSGYVVESSIKSLWLYELGGLPPGQPNPWGTQHSYAFLSTKVAALVSLTGSKSARYFGPALKRLMNAKIAAWTPSIRYRAAQITPAHAGDWVAEAQDIYAETIGRMRLDGVL